MEISYVFVVGEDLNRDQGSVEVMSPGLQGGDDGQEFSIIDIVIPFCRRE